MKDYPAKRLKIGVLQASMYGEGYRIERWSGTRWEWAADLPTSVVIPFKLCANFATKREADRALQASGLPWRK